MPDCEWLPASCRPPVENAGKEGFMQRVFTLGILMLVMISLLVGLYQLLEPVQEWLVFTAIVATAMAQRSTGGTP